MRTSEPFRASSRSSRLLASARQQPEFGLRCQQQLPPESRELFATAVARPADQVAEVSPVSGPSVKKCRPVAKNAMSAQLEWFARSVGRPR